MGKVLQVGGIKPKVRAVLDARVKTVILPEENYNEFDCLPDYIRSQIEAIFVSSVNQVLDAALIKKQVAN